MLVSGQVPGMELLKPLEFLGGANVFCPNVTPAELLDEDWSPERLSHDQRLGIFSLPPPPQPHLFSSGGKMKLLIHRVSVMKPP